MSTQDHVFWVRGASMFPTLRSGDKVIIKKYSVLDLNVRDIVVANINGRNICHRIIKKNIKSNSMEFTLKGDCRVGVELVQGGQVLGKAIAFERQGKICLLRFVNSKFYVWFAAFLAMTKAIIIKVFSLLYSFSLVRKLLRRYFSLRDIKFEIVLDDPLEISIDS